MAGIMWLQLKFPLFYPKNKGIYEYANGLGQKLYENLVKLAQFINQEQLPYRRSNDWANGVGEQSW